MTDFLDILGKDACERVSSEYYNVITQRKISKTSLKKAVIECEKAPIISEIKSASPSMGVLKKDIDAGEVAKDMEDGGSIGISVLTEPTHFNGSIEIFNEVRTQVELPLLMKDIIVNQIQIEAAAKMGANAVLLIDSLFKRGYCACDVHGMIAYAHSQYLEVLLEVHTEEEYLSAQKTEADLVGINNRDLRTLEVDLRVTKRILAKNPNREKLVVSESGIRDVADIRSLHRYGVHAYLVGSSIMKSKNIKKAVKELVTAL